MYVYEDCGKDWCLIGVTGIFNMTGNVNLRDFTSFHTNSLISDFENLVISLILNKISVGVYEIWQQLVTPRLRPSSRVWAYD